MACKADTGKQIRSRAKWVGGGRRRGGGRTNGRKRALTGRNGSQRKKRRQKGEGLREKVKGGYKKGGKTLKLGKRPTGTSRRQRERSLGKEVDQGDKPTLPHSEVSSTTSGSTQP